jgi:methylmalonyl-CoA/ethylmalonyl-CoA epimerase
MAAGRTASRVHFDHAGVATDDATGLAALYETLFDAPVVHEETFDGLRVVFLDLGGDGYFELLEPLDDDTTIASYLARNGPGIHHVALATDDIEAALETAREAGVDCIDEEPRPGAWGHDVAFLHPKSTGGALVEFVQH